LAAAAGKADEDVGRSDMRCLRLVYLLGLAPLVGGRYRFENMPIGGSTGSFVMTAHGSTVEYPFMRYGSSAHHIFEFSNADANWFVPLGGRDVWHISASFADQVAFWQSDGYVQLRLRLDSVRRRLH